MGTSAYPQTACGDLKTLDVRNTVLGPWVLENGKALEYENSNSRNPEWEVQITKDTIFQPERGILFRVLQFERNHLKGSGQLRPIRIIQCRDGEVSFAYANDNATLLLIQEKRIRLQTFGKYLGGTKGFETGPILDLTYHSQTKSLIELKK